MDTLLKDIPFESVPQCLGGGFALYNEQLRFDLSEEGPLYYSGAPAPPPSATASSPAVAQTVLTFASSSAAPEGVAAEESSVEETGYA